MGDFEKRSSCIGPFMIVGRLPDTARILILRHAINGRRLAKSVRRENSSAGFLTAVIRYIGEKKSFSQGWISPLFRLLSGLQSLYRSHFYPNTP